MKATNETQAIGTWKKRIRLDWPMNPSASGAQCEGAHHHDGHPEPEQSQQTGWATAAVEPGRRRARWGGIGGCLLFIRHGFQTSGKSIRPATTTEPSYRKELVEELRRRRLPTPPRG
jgi:hypothetical protein